MTETQIEKQRLIMPKYFFIKIQFRTWPLYIVSGIKTCLTNECTHEYKQHRTDIYYIKQSMVLMNTKVFKGTL